MLANSDGNGGFTTPNLVRHEAFEAYSMASGKSLEDAHDNNPFPGLYILFTAGKSDSNGNITETTSKATGGELVDGSFAGSFTVVKSFNPPVKPGSTVVPKGSIVVTFTPNQPKKQP
jgi:hypothetical protein